MSTQVVHFCKNAEGGNRLTVSSNTTAIFMTEMIEEGHLYSEMSIRFLNAQGEGVTPTGGTIEGVMSDIEGIWLEPSNNNVAGSIDATEVIFSANASSNASHTLPLFRGPHIRGAVRLINIAGATSAECKFTSFQ